MHRDPLPGRKRFSALAGSSDALALARLAADARPLAVFTANALDASRLLEELRWFDPRLRACLLPDWETLPYDSFSPHHDLVSERLATLYRIQRSDFDVLFVPAASALFRLCPPSYLAAYTFFLRQGERLDADALRRQLADINRRMSRLEHADLRACGRCDDGAERPGNREEPRRAGWASVHHP